MIDHDDVLNRLLANACPRRVTEDDKGEVVEFTFDLHCMEATVTARYEGNLTYEVLNLTLEAN